MSTPPPPPPSDDDRLAAARVHLARGDWAAAEAALARIAPTSAAYARALVLGAKVALAAGRPEDAEDLARRAYGKQAGAEPAFVLGEALLALDDPGGAQRALEIATGFDPDHHDAYILHGHALAMQDRLKAAMASYQEALRLDDASAPARYFMAETLVRMGEVVRASGQLHLVVKKAPDYGPAYVLRGDIALHHGDHRQAAAEYCRGIALDAADAPVYERLGLAFQALGDLTQAVKAFDGAIHLEPDRWACHVAAGEACEEAGWLNRARRYWEALAAVPEHRAAAREGLERVAFGIARTGLEGIDPPGAPPERAELKGFTPPAVLERGTGPAGRPGSRVAGPPPPLDDLLSTPAPQVTARGTAMDGFGTSASAAGFLADFREPAPPAPPAAEAPAEPAAPAANPVLSKLEALQAKLRKSLE